MAETSDPSRFTHNKSLRWNGVILISSVPRNVISYDFALSERMKEKSHGTAADGCHRLVVFCVLVCMWDMMIKSWFRLPALLLAAVGIGATVSHGSFGRIISI